MLIDSFFVRSVFVPALVALFGRQRMGLQTEAATTDEAPPAPERRAA